VYKIYARIVNKILRTISEAILEEEQMDLGPDNQLQTIYLFYKHFKKEGR
jgi:hypothetical protein